MIGKEAFYSQICNIYEGCIQSDIGLAKTMRTNAWERFADLSLPDRKVETYQYFPLSKLYSKKICVTPKERQEQIKERASLENHLIKGCYHLIFVNGLFVPSLSFLPEGVDIQSFDQALKVYSSFISNRINKRFKIEKDPFAMLNIALQQKGVFIYLPPNKVLDAPLQILHWIDTDNQPLFFSPYIQIFAGKHAQASLVMTICDENSQGVYFRNSLLDIAMAQGANLSLTIPKMECSLSAFHFDSIRVEMKRDCSFKSVVNQQGEHISRFDYHVVLEEENSEANLYGLSNMKEKGQSHVNVLIDHKAPHCRSFQLFKNVLEDFSKASFEGKIYVESQADKTDAFQLNNNLLLSEKASVNSKPNLEIFADDVKASHGATCGQLNQEELFYLLSRGCSKKQAENLLVQGFKSEIINLIPSNLYEN